MVAGKGPDERPGSFKKRRRMDISTKVPRSGNEHSDGDLQRRDAPFSEIYELIFYNQSLVRSELEILQLLIQKKLKQGTIAEPDRDYGQAHQAYKRQAVIGRILKTE